MPNLRHRRSIRLKNFDYTEPGVYFITIVTFERQNLFGEIVNDTSVRQDALFQSKVNADPIVLLNDFGLVVKREWERLPNRFPGISLDAFVVMPNHLHGIVVIEDECRGTGGKFSSNNRSITPRAPTAGDPEQFGKPVSGSLPTIVRSFKASVTYRAGLIFQNDTKSVWQHNYYERVIRSDLEWANTRLYIENNPAKWEMDNLNRKS